MNHNYKDIICKKFNSKNQWVLVIGDVMLDQYIFGEVTRISPEAAVPIVEKKNESFRMGGAANVAANLVGLGIKTKITGLIGNDKEGEVLIKLLQDNNVNQQGLIKLKITTTTKIRVIAGHQQIVRIDEEAKENIVLSTKNINKIISLINQKPSIIILSDYAKGFLSSNLTQKIIKLAKKIGTTVLVDPKGSDLQKYSGSTVVTPNKKEALALTQLTLQDSFLLEKNLKNLLKKYNIANIAMTQGEEGIKLINSKKISVIPATKLKQVFDVSGAGDTVIATLAAGLLGKLTIHQSLELANIAAGIAIGKVGTVPVEGHEIINELNKEESLQTNKIVTLVELNNHLTNLRTKKSRIGFTNGCFDILHAGHVSYLEKAKNNIDYLILGLNSDSSVKRLKGSSRPVISQDDRARVLCSLESVDAVVIFDEDTPLKLIQLIKPDFLIKGSDYKKNEVIGNKEIKKWGGEVKIVELLEGRSTSDIIKNIS